MQEDQAQLTARALARAQLEGAYAAEMERRVVDDQALQQPALFNLSLAVRESDEDDEDDSLTVRIQAGQTPMEATAAFAEASTTPISAGTSHCSLSHIFLLTELIRPRVANDRGCSQDRNAAA